MLCASSQCLLSHLCQNKRKDSVSQVDNSVPKILWKNLDGKDKHMVTFHID
jgi:hypothetical protein